MIRSFALLLLSSAFIAYGQKSCETLKTLTLPDTTITSAESVPAGPFRQPGPAAPGPQQPATMVPAHCRVTAFLTPTSDSHIEIEVWLPVDWNNKYQAVGGGGWAGVISYAALAAALQEGYATSSTDTGHKGGDATFAPGHPEKLVDFAYRAVHEMTVKSKGIIAAFYGRAPKLSYWNGCSTGGRQGLMEAQKYPDDFDGIVAGAPANYHIHLHSYDMKVALAEYKDKDHMVPASKLALLNKAVLGACDALDGVKDGLLTDPRKCHYDPSLLLCKGGDAENCLTAAQIETIKAVYEPAKTSAGKLIYPALQPGGETGWTRLSTGSEPMSVSIGSFEYVLYQDPKWDWRTFDLEKDTAAADEKAGFINAISPDLSAFKSHGGKLLMYHGWSDQLISPVNSINYYSSVLSKMGAKQDNWYRLFMVPGMQHCRGGPGPNDFNVMGAMERWRESGAAPETMVADHVVNNRVDMARPLCPYPQVPVYRGVGSTNDASNFACKVQ